MESGGAHSRVGRLGLPVLRSVAASRVARARWLLATSSLVGAALLAPCGSQPALALTCDINDVGGATGPVTNSAVINCININNSTVTGNVTNTGTGTINAFGTVAPTGTGITITNSSTVTGAIINSGAIAAPNGIGILITGDSAVAGGITNGGTISAKVSGISLLTLSSFGGGITNTGAITTTGTIPNGTAIVLNGITTFSGNVSNSGTISAGFRGIDVANVSTFLGGIINSGTINAPNSDGILLQNVTAFTGGINNTKIISAKFSGISIIGNQGSFGGGVANSGTITSSGGDGIFIQDLSTFSGGVTNSGTISAKTYGIFVGTVSTFSGGIINNGTISGGIGIDFLSTTGASVFDSGTIVGTGGTAIEFAAGPNTLTLGPGFNIQGNVIGSGGDVFQLGGTGSGNFNLSSIGAGQQYQGFTTFNVVSGVWNTTGTFGQSQAWNVDGGTLAGTGTFQSINVNNGGTLQPGTPGVAGGKLTVSGSLVFATAATYLVNISPNAASSTSVTGQAALNGTIVLNGTGGTYKVGTTFDVLSATGGTSGTFSNVVITGNFGSTRPEVSYDDVMITLVPATLTGLLPPGAPLNAVNLAGGIDNFTGGGGTLPSGFQNLFNLPTSQLVSSLTQLDGEDATGAEHVSFDLMNEFLGLLLDPFVYGRGGDQNNSGGALGFAPDQQGNLPPDVALAYAGLLKAQPQQTFAQRWSTWASAFGGSATTNGDPSVGSNTVTTSTYGYAAGLDYHYSPDTVFGFSLAGGGTNWNLANALGTGRSDALLAGVYGVTHEGPWYLAGALAFANNWFTTNRTAAMGDQLNASFQGQSYSARLEGGYRFAVPADRNAVGITPYAALQVQDFQTPSYSETDLTGGGFGLSYNAMNGTDTRSELGARFDDLTALDAMPVILRAKVAWAHDWVSDPSLNASFASLPGTSFTVFGAPVPHDSALTSAGAQLFFTPNWSFLAKFDGEFASGAQTYAGSGTLRYAW
jgi:uncharacterized protein with beta-barrel porin domain